MTKQLSITISDHVFNTYLDDIPTNNRSQYIEKLVVLGAESEINEDSTIKAKYLKTKAKILEMRRKIEKLQQKEIKNTKKMAEYEEKLAKKKEKTEKTQGLSCNICGNSENSFSVDNENGRICETCYRTTSPGEMSDTFRKIAGLVSMKKEEGK